MFTIIAFILTVAGSINWLMIGLLQYDFIAGIFGYQGSVFSRIIYIIFGAACVFLVYKMFANKGTINVFSRRNKKDFAKNVAKMQEKQAQNVEAAKEQAPKEDYDSHFGNGERDNSAPTNQNSEHGKGDSSDNEKGLFNEHFGE